METKIEAIKRLQKHFTDQFGRICLDSPDMQDPSRGIYPTQNNNLWTGEINLLLTMVQDLPPDYFLSQSENFYKSYRAVELMPGLITRHPDPYRKSPHYDPVSLDEYNGVLFSMAVFEQYRHEADHMVSYGKKHGWAFIDDVPGANPFKTLKSDILGFVKTAFKVIYTAIKTKDFGGSGPMDRVIENNRAAVEISRIRLPKDRLLIKAVAKNSSPSVLDILHFFLANESTIKESNDETSGKIMAFFRFKALKLVNYNNFVVRLAEKRFKKKMKAKYGNNYMEIVFREYYKRENHPIHTLIKGLSY